MMSNLSRRPGVEHQNEIAAYKRRISKMSTEIKVETAQKNALLSRLEKNEQESEMLHEENRNWKQMYYDLKRKLTSQNWNSNNDVTNSEATSSLHSKHHVGSDGSNSFSNTMRGQTKQQNGSGSTVTLPAIENALKHRN
ncbi:uncharacterized protein LOC134845137 [Symsagittifera roscoffensis]|uniref:uncharacterized protein LOC134845137 n=1 Tax=Symsagittifera roscoffensis TaxID=84072 RepID=UPI00307C0A82